MWEIVTFRKTGGDMLTQTWNTVKKWLHVKIAKRIVSNRLVPKDIHLFYDNNFSYCGILLVSNGRCTELCTTLEWIATCAECRGDGSL